ncbi:permease [Clostridium transplantifaecale]|uniref:permease n=1 Tax=Clostridium transplantifaecale TaxID=2479838 RepID=UPI000F63F5D3|nr:permease [Clostridium transplantifaecale]
MAESIRREFIYLWYYFDLQFRQIFAFWALGILIGSVVSVFLKKQIHSRMAGLQNKKIGLWGILPASALGILSPLCMYGTIPIVASFSKSGMREDWIAAFMMSSILLNPQLFFYSFALGTEIAVLRLVVSFMGGCIAGILVYLFFKKQNFYKFTEFNLPENRDRDSNMVLRLIKNIWRNVKVTFPYFLLGVLLTALYQRYIPSQWIAGLFGSNRGLGALMAAALGVPLYTCGGGTIPLISAWLGEGMSKGSAMAFMIAGPATKLTNLGAVKIVLGMRNFILYMVFSILMSTAFGLAINLFL